MNRLIALIALILFSFVAVAIGCSSDDGAATCHRVTLEETDYCVYEGAITETGYDCPPDMPNLHRDEEFDIAVCSGESERPPFDEIEAARAASASTVLRISSESVAT